MLPLAHHDSTVAYEDCSAAAWPFTVVGTYAGVAGRDKVFDRMSRYRIPPGRSSRIKPVIAIHWVALIAHREGFRNVLSTKRTQI